MSVATEWLTTLKLGHRASPGLSVLTAVLIPGAAAGTALAAVGQRWVVDSAGAGVVRSVLIGAALAALGLGVSGSIGRVVTNLRNHLGHEAGRQLTRRAFQLISRRRDYQLLSDTAYADDVEVLRKHALALGNIGWTGVTMAAQCVGVVVALILLVAVHPVLGIAAVLVLLPVVLSVWAQRRTRAADEAATAQLRQEREIHADCTRADRVGEPRVYGAVPNLDAYATRLWDEAADRRGHARLLGALATTAGWLGFGAGLVIGLAVLGGELATGSASVGDVILVIVLTTGLRLELSFILLELDMFTDGVTAARAMVRVRAAAGGTSPTRTPPARLVDAITVENVSFTYATADHPALEQVNLRIPAGSVVAVIGLNGAGKSTLIDLLTGVLTPTSGRILFDGVDLTELDLHGEHHRISGAFQDFLRPPVSLGEAVGLGEITRIADEPAIRRAIDAAGASALVTSAPDGLHTKLTAHDGTDLSQGQWQKLAIARAYMNSAPLLVALDEPTSALDPAAEHDMFTTAVTRARTVADRNGTVTLLVSHRLAAAALADLIISVDNGRVVEFGTHSELLARRGRYHRLYEDQRGAYR
ncbi:ATP-binding cassette domain-containing protein [Nocardia sp. NPDC058176]|uniref:ATP-binding cassette domain-containing protein n=1 Tax=Nocardia sp. NPDC058176 TaxID=3346368 RepID=UPI0036DDCAC7